jgi:myo-inositol-1(or 4)-monophosphatase
VTPADLLPFAHALADAAGAAIRPWFRADLTIDDKGGKIDYDPVTEGDRAGEAAMRALLRSAHPTHGVLGEEEGRTPGEGPWEWVLDPIDGTRAFVAGLPTWGTIIGLRHEGRPVLGVVDQPVSGERWWGVGAEAWMRDHRGVRPLRTRGAITLAEARFATTTPELFSSDSQKALLAALVARTRFRRYGGDCYAYALLAMGGLDLVVERALEPYDIVGLIPIVEGAGGIVTSWTGGPAGEGGAVVASANPALHEEVLGIIRDLGATG